MARIVALDYGRKRIGIASCDIRFKIPTPFSTFECSKTAEETAQKLAAALQALQPITQVVFGLPLEMSGKEGVMAQEVRAFAQMLSLHLKDIPFVFWDERLTSAQVEKSYKDMSYSRKQRAKVSDTAAACLILDSYLQSHLQF